MPTTTIRLDDSMKERISAAADHAGKSAHAFILDAIADERWKAILASGQTVSWEVAKAYLVAKSRGKSPKTPLARSAKH
jgi:predicted transcriptional regulator